MTDFQILSDSAKPLIIELSQPSAQELSHQPMAGAGSSQLLFSLLKKRVGKLHFPGNFASQADTILCHLHMVPFLDI